MKSIDKKNKVLKQINHYQNLIKEKTDRELILNFSTTNVEHLFKKSWSLWTFTRIKYLVKQADYIKEDLQKIKKNLKSEKILNEQQNEMIHDEIKWKINKIKYDQAVAFIEAEKRWIQTGKDIKKLSKKRKSLENSLYGLNINQKFDRLKNVLTELTKMSNSPNFSNLTQQKQDFWNKKITEKFILQEDKKQIDEELKDYEISWESAKYIIKLLLEIEWIENTIILEEKKDCKELTQGGETLYFPTQRWDGILYAELEKIWLSQNFKIIRRLSWNASVSVIKKWEKFIGNHITIWIWKSAKYSLKKLLSTIADHEIATHVKDWITNANWINLNNNQRSVFEEWVALLNENHSRWENMQKYYQASIWDIWQFLWENFIEQDCKNLLKIYFKLKWKTKEEAKKQAKIRIKRIKFWVPFDEFGARRKDMVYWNGKDIVKEFLNLAKNEEWIEKMRKLAKAFYNTKLDHDQINNIDKILENVWNLEKMDDNFPIFAGKILSWKLWKNKLNKEKMLKEDIRSKIAHPKVTYKQKRLLVKILQIIRKEIW